MTAESYHTAPTSVNVSPSLAPFPAERLERISMLSRLFANRVIPLNLDKKGLVLWREYQERPPSDAKIAGWFRSKYPEANPGVLTGWSGVVVVDCDTAAAVDWADANLPPTPARVKTRRGEHRYYRTPLDGSRIPNRVGGHVSRSDGTHDDLGLDIRGHGGLIVAPGATHRSGHVYYPLGAFPTSIDALPAFDVRWFAGLCFCRAFEPGTRHRRCRADRSGYFGASSPIAPDGYVPERNRDGVRLDLAPRSGDRGRLIRRARALGAKHYCSVGSGHRDNALFAFACHLRVGFLLDESDALELLLEVNAGFTPPLDESTVKSKLRAADRYAQGRPGYLLDDDRERERRRRALPGSRRDSVPGSATAPPAGPVLSGPEAAGAPGAPAHPEPGERRRPEAPSFSPEDRDYLVTVALDHFERSADGRRRLRRVADCGLGRAEFTCDEHGVDHLKHLVCELGSACPYCATRRAGAHAGYVSEAWPSRVAVAVFEAPAEGDSSAALEALRQRRIALTKRFPAKLAYHWLLGLKRGLFFARATSAAYLQVAVEESGVPARIELVSKHEAARLIEEAWSEPARSFLDLVRRRDHLEVVDFPFVADESTLRRSDGSRRADDAEDVLPWLTQEELRARLSREAREERGDVDIHHCSKRDGNGCACAKPLKPRVTDERDGELILEAVEGTPFWKLTRAAFAALAAKRTRPGGAPRARPRARGADLHPRT